MQGIEYKRIAPKKMPTKRSANTAESMGHLLLMIFRHLLEIFWFNIRGEIGIIDSWFVIV